MFGSFRTNGGYPLGQTLREIKHAELEEQRQAIVDDMLARDALAGALETRGSRIESVEVLGTDGSIIGMTQRGHLGIGNGENVARHPTPQYDRPAHE